MIRGEDVHTELDELAANLEWASRTNYQSQSRKVLHRLLDRPTVLDLLERLVKAERERVMKL